jgi:hypothetical protein
MSDEKRYVVVLKQSEIIRIKSGLRLWLQRMDYDDYMAEGYKSIISSLESQVKKQNELTLATTGRN